jgi:hypothetical protein
MLTILTFRCADASLAAMSRQEFFKLARDQEANILLGLATNSFPWNTPLEFNEDTVIDLDVFMKFDVPTSVLNVIRTCVKASNNGKQWSPNDNMEIQKTECGRLRHFSDLIGGFRSVDAAIDSYRTKKAAAAAQKYRHASSPVDDIIGMFEWKSVGPISTDVMQKVTMNGSIPIQEFANQGYELAGSLDVPQARATFFHMRRMRDMALLDILNLSEAMVTPEEAKDNNRTASNPLDDMIN